MATLLAYLPWLLLTLALELPLVALLAPHGERGRCVIVGLALNVCTHPLLTLLAWRGQVVPIVLELPEFLIEAIGYRLLVPLSDSRALLIAAIANLATAIFGVFGVAWLTW